MSKDRLEEINQRILDMKRKSGMPNEVLTFKGWESVVPVFTKDIEYLVERVQELEELKKHYMKQIQFLTHSWDKSKEQNKRYREAREQISKRYDQEYHIQNNEYDGSVADGLMVAMNIIDKSLEGESDE